VVGNEASLILLGSDSYEVQIRAASVKGLSEIYSSLIVPGNTHSK